MEDNEAARGRPEGDKVSLDSETAGSSASSSELK